tara:strand:+ start:3340 stop:3534 length:195 start_codon:yes stop_codon:yes gene_type:complete
MTTQDKIAALTSRIVDLKEAEFLDFYGHFNAEAVSAYSDGISAALTFVPKDTIETILNSLREGI